MTKKDIFDLVQKGKYKATIDLPKEKKLPHDFVVDPTKPSIWNLDQVQQHNDNIDNIADIINIEKEEKTKLFYDDVIKYISETLYDSYDRHLLPHKLKIAADFIYEEAFQKSSTKNQFLEDSPLSILNEIQEVLDTIIELNGILSD